MDNKIIIALGSNWEQEKNIRFAMQRLRTFLPAIRFSRLLWTQPIGMESDLFLNVLGVVDLSGMVGSKMETADEIVQVLKQIEGECGRQSGDKAKGIVMVDLDLLQFQNQRFHVDDWDRDYVRLLLQEKFF